MSLKQKPPQVDGIGNTGGEDDERDAVDGGDEYVIEEMRDRLRSSRHSRFTLLENELFGQRKFSRQSVINGLKDLSQGFFIHPDNKWYKAWEKFILIWAIYSSFFTPMEFGFFRGLPKNLLFLDIAGQVAFLLDIILQFFVAYRDSRSYKLIHKRTPVALRYLKSHFIFDLLGCMPWDIIYKAAGRKEEVRYLLWIRLTRVRRVTDFFQVMEKDIRINYLFTRIVKLLAVELYCTHTAACIFYYLATTLPEEKEGYTWIGSLKMGDYSYSHFREIDLWNRYTTSLYFAIVTMATVGYGDIHAVNLREMIFVMIYVSFDMILGAYLIGNMTALIVKGSKTERYRDKTTDLMKYMNRNKLGRDLRNQIKGHLRLQYESSYTDAAVLQDIPISIRAKISQTLYKSYVENIPLFKDCSLEFINQTVTKVHEEFFLPGEVIMEQGNVVDQLYFVCDGVLEEVCIGADGLEDTVSLLKPNSLFGEISILCNVPQPYTVRVLELCRLLRIDKQSFSSILEIYFHDGRKIITNLLELKESTLRVKQLESDITFHIGEHEAGLALRVNSAAYFGDLNQLKSLIRAGADPNQRDYDGRSALAFLETFFIRVVNQQRYTMNKIMEIHQRLNVERSEKTPIAKKHVLFFPLQHLAAARGFEDITNFLLQESVDINAADNSGSTPILEAIKNGHDKVASLLSREGALLKIVNAGSFLCSVVANGESDLLRRVLSYGIDPNTKDYDHRTPLHIACSQGYYMMAKLLLDAGASVFARDRWGNTAVDEARMSGNNNMIRLLDDAKATQSSRFPDLSEEVTDRAHQKKCTVFPFHPWRPEEGRKHGLVMWVPRSIEDLIEVASKKLELPDPSCYCVLSEDAGKILDVDLITDGQLLYMINEQTNATP